MQTVKKNKAGSNQSGNKKDNDTSIAPWLLLIVVVAALTTIPYFIVFNGSLSPFHNDWIAFGEYVGGLTGTFLSLIAVLLIFITYRLQQRELKSTNAALKSQHEQMQRQQHIQMLFSLLERKDHVVNDIQYGPAKGGGRRKGLYALWKLKDKIDNDIAKCAIEADFIPDAREKELRKFFKEKEFYNKLVVYYRLFLESIKFLDQLKNDTDEEKAFQKQLVNLYRANISNTENKLLNYLFEYLLHESDANRISDDEKVRVKKCLERINSLDALYLRDEVKTLLEANSSNINSPGNAGSTL